MEILLPLYYLSFIPGFAFSRKLFCLTKTIRVGCKAENKYIQTVQF